MDYRPLVSVITPTYNHSRFISRCAASVLEQSYPRWEQFIVDDGSTDSTPDIVAAFSDERVHYIRREHKGLAGLAEAYNTALKASNGEIVAILEGDDSWPRQKLETQVRVFRRSSRVPCGGGM